MMKIGVGVIGLGHNGLEHCENYTKHPKSRLVAVCDNNQDRLDYAVERFGVKGYNGYEIFHDNAIQAISVNTSDDRHREPFQLALETGHHVFVEKPMANSLEDAKAMVDVYRKHTDKKVLVGHVLRFDNYFSLVKKRIDMGILGEINYVQADYIHDLRYQFHMEKWKVDEEIPMVGGGCHPLDLLRWYVGDVVEVASFSNRIAYPEMIHDASMIAMLRFQNGAIGKVTALYGNPGPMPNVYNMAVYGTKGRIEGGKMFLDGMDEHGANPWLELPSSKNQTQGHPFYNEIDHFLTCIEKDQKPLVTPEDAYNTIAAALYAVKACRQNSILKIPALQ